MLKEFKTRTYHYFIDEQRIKHGEFKHWHDNGKIKEHCFYVNGNMHGEYKQWHENGQLFIYGIYVNNTLHGEYKLWALKKWYTRKITDVHCFFVNGKEVPFNKIPYPTTNEDRMFFMLKYDLQLLPVEPVC